MSSGQDQTTQLQSYLDRLRADDDTARRALLDHAYRRLESLAHIKLGGFPKVRSRADTGDVLNEAVLRLDKALRELKPATVREFFGLASKHIRWVLLELKRGRYALGGLGGPGADAPGYDVADVVTGPATFAEQAEFHERVDALPEEPREVFELLFYQGLSQAEAASLLGVSERTIKRRWREARIALDRELGGAPDE